MAKRSNKIFRVQPLAGAAANLADVPHEGMCRGAAANAKEGCNKLVKQTAVTTTTTKTIRTNFKANSTPLPTCVFKGMFRQKNDVCKKRKRPRTHKVPRPSGSFFRLAWLSLIGLLASRARLRFTKQPKYTPRKNEAKSSERKMYVQSQKPSRKNYWKPPLDTNFSFREVAHKHISSMPPSRSKTCST